MVHHLKWDQVSEGEGEIVFAPDDFPPDRVDAENLATTVTVFDAPVTVWGHGLTCLEPWKYTFDAPGTYQIPVPFYWTSESSKRFRVSASKDCKIITHLTAACHLTSRVAPARPLNECTAIMQQFSTTVPHGGGQLLSYCRPYLLSVSLRKAGLQRAILYVDSGSRNWIVLGDTTSKDGETVRFDLQPLRSSVACAFKVEPFYCEGASEGGEISVTTHGLNFMVHADGDMAVLYA